MADEDNCAAKGIEPASWDVEVPEVVSEDEEEEDVVDVKDVDDSTARGRALSPDRTLRFPSSNEDADDAPVAAAVASAVASTSPMALPATVDTDEEGREFGTLPAGRRLAFFCLSRSCFFTREIAARTRAGPLYSERETEEEDDEDRTSTAALAAAINASSLFNDDDDDKEEDEDADETTSGPASSPFKTSNAFTTEAGREKGTVASLSIG